MSDKICKNCIHANQIPVEMHGQIGQEVFECTRFPPVPTLIPTPNGPVEGSLTPKVKAVGYCGEFESAVIE